MLKKKLGVYLLSYKRPEYILQTIESILAQDYENFNLIVSDNTPNDSVSVLLKNLPPDERLKILCRKPSLPALEHFNSVIGEAAGQYEYFMLFHDDDLMLPHGLKTLMAAIENDPVAAAVACNARIIQGTTSTEKLFNPNLKSKTIVKNSDDLIRRYLTPQLSHTPFPSYIYRSAKTRQTGMNFQDGGKHSDVSFLVKLIQNGHFIWLSEELMLYRRHSQNDSNEIVLSQVYSLTLFYFKNSPRHALRALLFLLKSFVLSLYRR